MRQNWLDKIRDTNSIKCIYIEYTNVVKLELF